ncbi:MAG: YceI family protein [Bacteroidetes bacterium]|nr:YceI family protein [Bacteroidota bacterium]
MKRFNLLGLFLLIGAAAFAQAKWVVNKPHARIAFTVSHLALSDVDGNFRKFDATLTSSKPDFSDAVFEVNIDAASVNTDNDSRDNDLRSDHFLEVTKYPNITFVSKGVTKTGDKTFKLNGDLTIHGVTKPVTLDMVITGVSKSMQTQKPIAGFRITGAIDRTDFGVGHLPAAIVGDKVELRAVGEFDQE